MSSAQLVALLVLLRLLFLVLWLELQSQPHCILKPKPADKRKTQHSRRNRDMHNSILPRVHAAQSMGIVSQLVVRPLLQPYVELLLALLVDRRVLSLQRLKLGPPLLLLVY